MYTILEIYYWITSCDLDLAHDESFAFQAKDVWFNGFRHIPQEEAEAEILAGKHGEELTDLLCKQGRSWNQDFDGKAVAIPDDEDLITVAFEGGLTVTLLGPMNRSLAELRHDWEHSCEDIDLTPEELEEAREEGRFELLDDSTDEQPERPDVEKLMREPYKEDPSAANGSSIALLVEYQGVRILLTGDAHPTPLVEAIGRMGEGKLKLDVCKLPHHGSRGSVSVDLIKALDCANYVFSSNGDQFKHPHGEAVARVIRYGGDDVKLHFNYRSDETRIWDDDLLREAYGYSTAYPDDPAAGLILEWEDGA